MGTFPAHFVHRQLVHCLSALKGKSPESDLHCLPALRSKSNESDGSLSKPSLLLFVRQSKLQQTRQMPSGTLQRSWCNPMLDLRHEVSLPSHTDALHGSTCGSSDVTSVCTFPVQGLHSLDSDLSYSRELRYSNVEGIKEDGIGILTERIKNVASFVFAIRCR